MVKYDPSLQARKGKVLLHRLEVSLPFESTIEERLLRLLDVCVQVRRVERAPGVQVFLPDGTSQTYTPDYTVELTGGSVLSLECKPMVLLPSLLEAQPVEWQARAYRLEQEGRPLHFVTERDLPPVWLQQAKTFGSFHGVEVSEGVRRHALQVLSERGAMPMTELRAYLGGVKAGEHVDATLYGMLARYELVADIGTPLPDCMIDLSNGGSLPFPPPPVGLPLREVLAQVRPDEVAEGAVPPVPAVSQAETRFLKTQRGQRALRLFTLYSDPSVPLTATRVEELMKTVGVSRRTLFHFRQALLQAGAPGLTFSDLLPHLTGEGGRKPRRQVVVDVATIMERLTRDHYFVPLGTPGRARSISDLHQMVRKACLAEELVPPVYNTVKKFVARMEQRDPVAAATLRQGREAAQKLEARQGRLEIRRYGELIGIDCTPCDVFTREEGVIAVPHRSGRGKSQRHRDAQRGNIVTVVDVATSQILRSAVFSGAISAARILHVLRDVFLGDTGSIRAAGVIEVPQARGLPQAVRMDAGTEFVNRQVSRVLAYLGIEVVPRSKWNRHFGGVEERTIGTLSHLHHVLPGTSTNNITNRGEYDAQRGALLTITDLDRFHQRAVERHNALCAPLSALTRQQHAQRLLDTGMSVWRPLSASQEAYLRQRMHPQEIRKCCRDGLSLHGLTYTSPQLAPLIVKQAKVEVLFNPDDISVAQAVHPETGVLIELEARLPEGLAGPLSLQAWVEIKGRLSESRQAALDRVRTPQQLVAEVMQVREQKKERPQAQERRGKQQRTPPLAALKPLPVEKSGSASRIKSADVLFDDNPPSLEA